MPTATQHKKSWVNSRTPEQKKKLRDFFSEHPEDALRFYYDWSKHARPKQLLPSGDWQTWLIDAGRGWGKTRAAAEATRMAVEELGYRYIALVGRTPADVRDVMIEGPSGLKTISPPGKAPTYSPSHRRLTWPNGAKATTYSSKVPDHLRGPQHDWIWADEPATWYNRQVTWDTMMLGLRVGSNPRCVASTTPKPVTLIKKLLDDPTVHVTTGSTYENRQNLAPAFFKRIVSRYEGTSLGQQELYARLLLEIPNAMWNRALLEKTRIEEAPPLSKIVVAIDPAGSTDKASDETGIVVCGVAEDGYVLEDLSGCYSPRQWATKAVNAYEDWEADLIVAEKNFGGDMVMSTIKTVLTGSEHVPVKLVHAARGKRIRAQPIASLYEQGRIHHVGVFEDLEDQLVVWTGEKSEESPDRLDAMVHGMSELMITKKKRVRVF